MRGYDNAVVLSLVVGAGLAISLMGYALLSDGDDNGLHGLDKKETGKVSDIAGRAWCTTPVSTGNAKKATRRTRRNKISPRREARIVPKPKKIIQTKRKKPKKRMLVEVVKNRPLRGVVYDPDMDALRQVDAPDVVSVPANYDDYYIYCDRLDADVWYEDYTEKCR